MPVISFWNNSEVETGKTTSMIAFATYMAVMHNYKILVIDTKFNSDSITPCFWEENDSFLEEELNSKRTDISSGIEGLAKAVMSNKSSPEIITNYTRIVFRDRLEILLGMKTKNLEDYNRTAPVYKDIINFAKKTYDMVFVDLPNGFNEMGTGILEMSDLIIINTLQRLKMVMGIEELRSNNLELLARDKTLINLGRYDRYSKYNAKNLARLLREKKELLCVPYCTQFFEATVDGKVADYFIKYNRINDLTDSNAMFIMEVKRSVERIIYRLQELQMKM